MTRRIPGGVLAAVWRTLATSAVDVAAAAALVSLARTTAPSSEGSAAGGFTAGASTARKAPNAKS